MSDFIWMIVILGGWIIFNRYLAPRLGIPT